MDNNNNNKRKAPTKTTKGKNAKPDEIEKPKRFLTAYNFFFMNERAEFLRSHSDSIATKEEKEEEEESTASLSDTDRPWTKKRKRPHKKTHGKIGFKSLSKRVATKWKSMSPEEKKIYEDKAGEDLDRYRHEMSLYKKHILEAEKARFKEEKEPCESSLCEDPGGVLLQPRQEPSIVPEQVTSSSDTAKKLLSWNKNGNNSSLNIAPAASSSSSSSSAAAAAAAPLSILPFAIGRDQRQHAATAAPFHSQLQLHSQLHHCFMNRFATAALSPFPMISPMLVLSQPQQGQQQQHLLQQQTQASSLLSSSSSSSSSYPVSENNTGGNFNLPTEEKKVSLGKKPSATSTFITDEDTTSTNFADVSGLFSTSTASIENSSIVNSAAAAAGGGFKKAYRQPEKRNLSSTVIAEEEIMSENTANASGLFSAITASIDSNSSSTIVNKVPQAKDDIESMAMESLSYKTKILSESKVQSLSTSAHKKYNMVYESHATRILHIPPDPQNKLSSKPESVAIKLLYEDFPTEESLSKLENEYEISNKVLWKCDAARGVLKRINCDGSSALCLEWVEGVTLKEWIGKAHKMMEKVGVGGVGSLKIDGKTIGDSSSSSSSNPIENGTFDHGNAVWLAKEIAKALSEIHDCGVVHNKFGVENIIVDTNHKNKNKNKNTDSPFSVKIIDLGLASFMKKEHDKRNDLISLGAVLFELFLGISPFTGGVCWSTFQNNCCSNDPQELRYDLRSLFRNKVPPCISTLVFNLLQEKKMEDKEGGKRYHYQSVSDVYKDLSTILADYSTLLPNKNSQRKKIGPFYIKRNKLYGRDDHVRVIMDAYRRLNCRSESLSEAVMISGYAGAGKSALVCKAKESMIDDKGIYFLEGKFDQCRQMEPLSAIIASLSGLCDRLSKNPEKIEHISAAIQEQVGSEASVLVSFIPSLAKIIQSTPKAEVVNVGVKEAQNRFKFVFRLFIRAITPPSQPLVLFLDDLQWADPVSLETIESLVTDTENKSLLFIGSYRDNEINETHRLNLILRTLENKKVVMSEIKVGNLSREETNALISDLIQTSPSYTQSLNNAVYRKTSGNALFVLQFLMAICGEGSLYFCLDSRQWKWNTSVIESKRIPDSTVGLMSCKILQLPETTQNALKMIACLGSCDDCVLSLITTTGNHAAQIMKPPTVQLQKLRNDHSGLIISLDIAVNEGLINHTGSKYEFSHDLFRLAAYSLIPEAEKDHWHQWIGSQIWANKCLSPEKALFIAVGQLNKVKIHIKNGSSGPIQLAELNLRAGKKSLSLCAFVPAAFYLQTGMNLLDDSCWDSHYDICLQMYESYANAEYCNGKFDAMNKALCKIFKKARQFDDLTNAYITFLKALGAQGKFCEALKTGNFVLRQLGEPMPNSSGNKSMVMAELSKTHQMLRGKPDAEILALKEMKDHHKINAMHFMSTLSVFTFFTKQDICALMSFRMVQISLRYGICKHSAIGFAMYGSLLSCAFNDIVGGQRFGQLSLHLSKRSQAKEFMPRVYCSVFSFIHSWNKHHHASLEPLENAYTTGMRYGDVASAMTAAGQYCIHSYQCGVELPKVEKMFREYGQKMKEYKQEGFWIYTLAYRQTALNLMGHSHDPMQLIGDAMDQEKILKYATENKRLTLVKSIYHLRCWLAYIFGDYKLASQMIVHCKVGNELFQPTYSTCSLIFVEGLISSALACKTNEQMLKDLAFRAIEKIGNFAKYAPSNYLHMYLLLQAESSVFLGENANAAKMYDSAIKVAGDNRFIQDQAIAYERAGIFHLERGNSSVASHYYGQAHDAYLRWGAKCKADKLRLHCPF